MASSSTVDKPRPPKPPKTGEWIEYDQFIDRQIRKTRGQVKGVEIASALMTLATGALAFFLVAAVLDHWVLAHGLEFWGRLLCLALFLGGAGYYAAEKLLPWLIYRINPIYAAQAIEKSRPTLKNSLINFLFLRGQSAHVPKAIYEAVEQQAANGLSRVTVESAVDRSRLIHIGYALLTVVGLFAAYFLFSPKSPWDTIGRVIMPWANIPVPTRVDILDPQPGTRTVFRGETVDVSAEIRGLKEDEPVRVVYSTADHEAVDQPVTMYLPPERFRHSAKIPPANASGQQSAGVQQDIDYRIEAGDAVSPTYHLKAVTAPTISVDSVDYQFPDYTGRARITLKGIGDIQAIEGTRVVIHGHANETIKSAQLELFGREHPTKLAMQVGDGGKSVTGSFTLAFDEQDRTAPQFSHYLLRPEGRAEPEPVRYRIDVIPDLAPDVKFIAPEKDEVALPVNGRLKLKLRALDPDFALSDLSLSADSSGKNLFVKRLLTEVRRQPMQVDFTIDPAKLHLKDGDIVEYWATAKDNRQPTPNTTQTARRRIHIVAADARQGDASQTQGDDQGAGNPADKSNKPSGADKSNDNKQPQDDAQKQEQPQADKPAGEKSDGAKSPKQPQTDKQDGAENQPENQPQDAAHDPKQEKPSPDQQQNQNGGTKQQNPSNKQKSDGSKNASDKQDSDKDQGGKNQKPDDKQQGGGGSKSGQNNDKSAQKSDSGKGGSDSKSGGDKSGSDKSGGDKSGGDKSGSNDSQQDGAGGQQKNADKNANPQGQRNQRPESDGSDDVNALQRTLQHLKDAAKNGSQGKPSDQSQNADGQKQPGGEKQPGGKQSDSKNSPDSQPKPGDGQKPAGAKQQPSAQQTPNGQKPAGGQPQPQSSQQKTGDQSPKSTDAKKPSDGQKPQDGQKPGDKSAGEKSQGGSKSGADKPNGEQPSTKEGDAQNTAAKKNGSDESAADKSKGANSTKEDAPNKPSGDKADSSKSGDKSDKPGTEQNRDSSDGQNKSGSGDQQDKGNGERTKDGSQPTGDKQPPQGDKDQSKTKAGDPDSNKGAAGAGEDTAKDDKATPPAPSDANQPKDHKNQQPKSAGKKESQGKDEGKSPTTSPKESDSQGDQDGDRSGGGKKGGGQSSNQAGTGGAGQNTAADQGKGVAKGHGHGEDSSKAGSDKAASHQTGKSGDKEGPGSHTKAADSDHPNNPAPAKSEDDQGKSSASAPQGSAGKSPDNPSGPGSSGYEPRGGGNNSGTPPSAPPTGPETTGDAANPEFAKKQFDMALESLKKGKPDLLKELNWTPEEARKLAERLEQMRRNAEVPGAKGDDARRQMNELLQSLGSRGGQVDRRSGGNATDTQRGLRESHDAGPPPEYSEQVEAFQQGILQGGK